MNSQNIFTSILMNNFPMAIALIQGNSGYPDLHGKVFFYNTPFGGALVYVEVNGLPDKNPSSNFYGLHIHEFGNCTLPFDKTGNHYNPGNTQHPWHAGDLPPLLGNNGYAWMCVYTGRFSIPEILGKSVVIHGMRDDFTSQPSGDSGAKIGCGVIRPAKEYSSP